MINCPNCKADKLFVIDSRTAGHGGFIRRRLKCGICDERFTSHEIREGDLAETNADYFSERLSKIRREWKVADSRKPNGHKVFFGSVAFTQCMKKTFTCFFSGPEDTVNY